MLKGSQPAPHSRTIKLRPGKRSKTPERISWVAEKGPPVVISTWPMIHAAASWGDVMPDIGDEMPPWRVMGISISRAAAQYLSSSGLGEAVPLGKDAGDTEIMHGRSLRRRVSAMASSMLVTGIRPAPLRRSGYWLQKSDSQLL